MHECRFFDDKDKGKIVDIYKKLMFIRRHATEANISNDETDEVGVISDFFKEWSNLKNELMPFMEKIKSCWKKETEIEEKLEYFG